jgi:hypothetical protein
MRKTCFVVFLVLPLIILFSGSALAIYSWVDEHGVYHISDYPKPGKRQEEQTEPVKPKQAAPAPERTQMQKNPVQEQKPPAAAQQPLPPAAPPQAAQQNKAAQPQQRPLQDTVKTPVPQQQPQQDPVKTPVPRQQPQQGTLKIPVPQPPAPPMPAQPVSPPIPQPHMARPLPGGHGAVPPADVIAFIAAFGTVILIVSIGFYVYFSLCMYLIAKKLDVPAPWTAWVPILNIWPFFASAGKSLWWVLLMFIPFVNFIVVIYLWMCITENLSRNKWLGLLMLVPVANLVYPAVLAFSSGEGRRSPSVSTA